MARALKRNIVTVLSVSILSYALLLIFHTSIAQDAEEYAVGKLWSPEGVPRSIPPRDKSVDEPDGVEVERNEGRRSMGIADLQKSDLHEDENKAVEEVLSASESVVNHEEVEASPSKREGVLVLPDEDRFPDPIEEILPPFRLAPTMISVFTYRDYRFTYHQAIMKAKRCNKPTKQMLPAGKFTVRYVSGAWKDSNVADSDSDQGDKQWTVSFSMVIANKTVFSMSPNSWHNNEDDAKESVTSGTVGEFELVTAEEIEFRTQHDWSPKMDACDDDEGEMRIVIYVAEKGCVPIRGSVRPGTDLGRYEWDEVPNAEDENDWEACCKLCGLTNKCQTWESNPQWGCILKHGTPEEERVQNDAVVSGKRPSTGIAYESGLHRPTKLFVASHPDDDALFFGEHLKDGYHEDSFNDWYIVTTTLDYVYDRKFEERQSNMIVNANYEMWGWHDIFCAKTKACNPILDIGLVHDLADLLTMRPWTDIVTHNHLGDYGNPFHVGMNRVIMNLTQELIPEAQVWVFDPRPDDPDVTHLVWNMTEAIEEHLERLLSETKRDLLKAYFRKTDRTIHYRFWLENVVKVEEYNKTHSKYVCEHFGEGVGNICCEEKCVEDYEWMLAKGLKRKREMESKR